MNMFVHKEVQLRSSPNKERREYIYLSPTKVGKLLRKFSFGLIRPRYRHVGNVGGVSDPIVFVAPGVDFILVGKVAGLC